MHLALRLLAASLSLSLMSEAPAESGIASGATTKLHWTINLAKLQTNRDNSFLFPLPVNSFGQSASYKVSGATRSEVIESISSVRILRIYPRGGPVTVDVEVKMDYSGLPDPKKYDPTKDAVVPLDVKQYLKTTCGMDGGTSYLKQVADGLRGLNHMETAKKVFRYVHEHLKEDYKYWSTADEILRHGVAQCEGHSALATALLRQLGIPSRMIFFVFPNKPKGNVIDGHTIVQFYLPGSGWLIADPEQGDNLLSTITINFGEEPIPYYFCRVGMGALVQKGQTFKNDYPAMEKYLGKPENSGEYQVATCMYDFFNVMYDCTVEKG